MDVQEAPSSKAFYFKGEPSELEKRKGERAHAFTCRLKAIRCREPSTTTGKQCRRHTVIGTGFCWQHLLMNHHLYIGKSKIPQAGMGVFAAGMPGSVVFKKGDVVVYYRGDPMTPEELFHRYNEFTAPYAVGSIKGKKLWNAQEKRFVTGDLPILDSACLRSVGAVVNHKPPLQCNTKWSVAVEDDHQEVCLRAIKPIRANDEIYVNYGNAYKMKGRLAGMHETRPIQRKAPVWYA